MNINSYKTKLNTKTTIQSNIFTIYNKLGVRGRLSFTEPVDLIKLGVASHWPTRAGKPILLKSK